jgi:hypothetical protein
VSADPNASSGDRETWITVTTALGDYRYWGDPEEPVPWDEFDAAAGSGEPEDEFDQPADWDHPDWSEDIPDLPEVEVPQEEVPRRRRGPRFECESRFKPRTLKELADLPPPEWLIDGLLPEDGLVVLYGEPAVGKSFLALDWGLCVATGLAWFGREVKRGEVVYIYAEGVRGIRRRADAWRQEHRIDDAPHFLTVPVAVTIPDKGERTEFVEAVKSVSKKPGLIVIDTLARNFGPGNESLAQDMNAFVNGCDQLRAAFPGATILVVHHSGKEKKKGARGSLALQGATDAVFALTRSGDALKLVNEKQKDGEEASPIALKLARVSLPEGKTSCVIRPLNGGPFEKEADPNGPRKDPRTVRTDADCLKALAGFGPEGAPLADWERAAGKANDTFYASRDRLVADGKVIVDRDQARYIAAEPDAGPGPGVVQDGSNRLAVQKVSPEVPP